MPDANVIGLTKIEDTHTHAQTETQDQILTGSACKKLFYFSKT